MAKTRESESIEGSEPKPFRLLDLPDELWTRIIEMAVTQPTALYASFSPTYQEIGLKEPSLAMTCRTIRAETLNLFYIGNEFCIPSLCKRHAPMLRQWIKRQMQKGHWDHIEEVKVSICCLQPEMIISELQSSFPNKKVVVQDCDGTKIASIRYAVRVED